MIETTGSISNPLGRSRTSELGPLVDIQLAQGYAVAASSYRLEGWALFETDPTKKLYDVFRRRVGTPAVILSGASLGGIVTIQAVEQAKSATSSVRDAVRRMAGGRNWDGALESG